MAAPMWESLPRVKNIFAKCPAGLSARLSMSTAIAHSASPWLRESSTSGAKSHLEYLHQSGASCPHGDRFHGVIWKERLAPTGGAESGKSPLFGRQTAARI